MDESLYRLIFDNTIAFVGLLDTHGTVLKVNRSALEFAGLSDTQMLTRAAWSTPWFIGETGVWLQDAIARASAGTFIRRDLSHLVVGAVSAVVDDRAFDVAYDSSWVLLDISANQG
jgi:PAS domain-containing protein